MCVLSLLYSCEYANAGLQDLIDEGLVPEARPVVLDFGNGVIHPDYQEFKTYFIGCDEIDATVAGRSTTKSYCN